MAAISLNWWVTWGPEDVGEPAGPYVLKVAVLAAIAVVAGAMAARAGHMAIVWSQGGDRPALGRGHAGGAEGRHSP
ncbi:hypothetical protein [Streptomyces cucumeris]|uniref:hypothetical protein n=1 Tax=Streptomyces cucumeris TaxID=2962890 RepID=UPI003D70F774